MENSTSSILTVINKFDIQQILNFNLSIFLSFLFYASSATFGVLIMKEIIKYLHNKWISRYERRTEEIKELNNRMHDRLVEIREEMELNRQSKDFPKIIKRLRYNASRLKKYDGTIFDDSNNLINLLSLRYEIGSEVIVGDHVADAKKLIEDIRSKIDKLWIGKN